MMTDYLPPGIGWPLAALLWGYLTILALIRHVRSRVSAHYEQALADWRECRAEYELALEAAYERAADACNDRLLNARGHAALIDPLSLFMGNERRAHAYASPELLEYWRQYPRVTFEVFERQWMAGRVYA